MGGGEGERGRKIKTEYHYNIFVVQGQKSAIERGN